MVWVHIKLPDGSSVPASADALERRLAPCSPLLVALHDFVEDSDMGSSAACPCIGDDVLLDIMCESPPLLWRGPLGMEALRMLVRHLGHPEDDKLVLDCLERELTVALAVHMHAVAHWLIAALLTQRLAAWVARVWLRAPRDLLNGLGEVDGLVLQAAVRAGLFRSACISESALCKAAESEVGKAEATIARLRPLAALLIQEGVDPPSASAASVAGAGAGVVEDMFPIFLKFQGRSHVVSGCTTLTSTQELKSWAASRLGVPEMPQRLIFEGKLLSDSRCLGASGVRRDSTVHLTVAPEMCRAKAPRSVLVNFMDGESHLVRVSEMDTSDDIFQKILDHSEKDTSGGVLCYAGRVLHPVVPLANYHLPEAARLNVLLRKRRRCL